MKNILLLGATGSIGTQTLDIIRNHPNEYKLVAFSYGHNTTKAMAIIKEFRPKLVVTPFPEELRKIKMMGIKASNEFLDVVKYPIDNAYVVNALVGSVGLIPTIEAIKNNRILLLANKESLVMAGELINSLLPKYYSTIVPIDSEHSGLYQLLKTVDRDEVNRLIITASGGALRDYPLEKLNDATLKEAINHPTWTMGQKITVDSSTMMNKVFEIIEAYYLFNFDYHKIHAVMDKESKIHAMIELNDGTIKYHYAKNDMHLPIEYAMQYPNSIDFNVANTTYKTYIEMKEANNLEDLDDVRFPLLQMAYTTLERGKFSGVILNASNEALVNKFIKGEIKYGDIIKGIMDAMKKFNFDHLEYNLENILYVNDQVIKEVSK